MKDLMKLVKECEEELKPLGIKLGTVTEWSINTRAKRRWGQCKRISEGVFTINISERLLHENIDDVKTKETIIHELLHTVPDSYGHKGQWKILAQKVSKELPHYTIKRTTSSKEKGIEEEPEKRAANYKLVCKKCGAVLTRTRKSRVVKYPDKYRCKKCGGRFKREY